MTDLVPLFPNQTVPPLRVDLAGGGRFDLASEQPSNFTLVVFYRGLHCPICKTQIKELESKLDDFEQRGVAVMAVSTDSKERAEQTRETWGLSRLRIGYGLPLAAARRWGLYVSAGHGKTSAGVDEPALFSEPAIYLVRPDGTLYFGSVQTMPFARPHFSDILPAIDFVVKNKYPARGEVADLRKLA
ncbi:peroxiredoxin-like family protein [Afipia sp. 1NLS2]|uniref:peroxiredoxin-like family protein n=1 Tax=Afipia sp. 1NLS2 TaxID=666684 RepID=UPI0001DA1277|nr:peroxiredoxin-like family protein [Afipia sp. 1NLS2]EFI52753.1 alkyl hydroperoxide reductase/ Thiol specific antioxidant/ Mal allergen [Afipia sp. 1NLS2]